MKATLLAVLALCAIVGCNQPAPQPKPAPSPVAERVPDYEFEPLTQKDVGLYLGVMKEAVERRKRLSPEDQKVLADEAAFYKHLKSGWRPDPNEKERALFQRADELHHIDYRIARSKGFYDRYAAIASAIEGMVGPEKCGDSDCGQGMPEDDPALRKKQIEDDKKRKAIIQQDLALLKPYEPEILAMAKELRLNPNK